MSPTTLMLTAFSYFFSQAIFKTFKVGLIINLLFALSFFMMLMINIKRKKNMAILKKNFFSKGFYVFVVIYICIFIFDFNRTMTMWDEFSHWGLMVHKDYPPILSLFELFYTNFLVSYQEPYLIRALHLFGCSLFIPAIFENISSFSKRKVILKSGLMLECIFLSILLFDQHGIIDTLYTDYIVAILTAYLLFLIVSRENNFCLFHLVQLSVGCSFLLLTKQVAIFFYLLVLLIFVVDLLMNRKEKISKIFLKNRKKQLLSMLLFLIIIPLSIWKGWNVYIEKQNITKQFETSHIEVTKLYGILSGKEGEKWQQETVKYYTRAIFTKGMMTTKISLSYLQCMVLICLLIYGLGTFYKKYIRKGQLSSILLVFIVGSLGYVLLMLLLYVFNFGIDEGPKLASFNRYMPTYLLIGICLLIMLFTYIDSRKEKVNSSCHSYIFLFFILFLIQNPKSLDKCLPKVLKFSENEFYLHAEIINRKRKIHLRSF